MSTVVFVIVALLLAALCMALALRAAGPRGARRTRGPQAAAGTVAIDPGGSSSIAPCDPAGAPGWSGAGGDCGGGGASGSWESGADVAGDAGGSDGGGGSD